MPLLGGPLEPGFLPELERRAVFMGGATRDPSHFLLSVLRRFFVLFCFVLLSVPRSTTH